MSNRKLCFALSEYCGGWVEDCVSGGGGGQTGVIYCARTAILIIVEYIINILHTAKNNNTLQANIFFHICQICFANNCFINTLFLDFTDCFPIMGCFPLKYYLRSQNHHFTWFTDAKESSSCVFNSWNPYQYQPGCLQGDLPDSSHRITKKSTLFTFTKAAKTNTIVWCWAHPCE